MDLFSNPISETYRLPNLCGSYHSTFTLTYPSKDTCYILGLVNNGSPLLGYRNKLFKHVRSKGRTQIIYYRQIGDTVKERVIRL